ncbi:MAG: DUF4830 domain-containing protein [Clostridia bacterium]|nr:DUF4830 domain-containing protein [Clostridia bacterium]
MFILSLKSLKGKMLLLVAAVVAAVIVLVIMNSGNTPAQASQADSILNFSADTQENRLNFISQIGYTVENEPISVKEVLIPSEFDEIYTQYNQLQLESGFDLSSYSGCAVKKWTYKVTDYPGYENSDAIQLTLLVYKGKIIGGDICSTELDGFMLPLFTK